MLQARRQGQELSLEQVAAFKTAVLMFLAKEYKQRGWVQQYHIGALRNNNSRRLIELGPDTGFDSINDGLVAAPRITSYNVCYTKLLRHPAGGRARRRQAAAAQCNRCARRARLRDGRNNFV